MMNTDYQQIEIKSFLEELKTHLLEEAIIPDNSYVNSVRYNNTKMSAISDVIKEIYDTKQYDKILNISANTSILIYKESKAIELHTSYDGYSEYETFYITEYLVYESLGNFSSCVFGGTLDECQNFIIDKCQSDNDEDTQLKMSYFAISDIKS